jgi:hypothetical protein
VNQLAQVVGLTLGDTEAAGISQVTALIGLPHVALWGQALAQRDAQIAGL